MKIAAHWPMTVTVAAGMALTGLAGPQVAGLGAASWQATAYHASQYRDTAGAIHGQGNYAGQPGNYPGDGSDDFGTTDSGGGGGAGG
jgi:hypothetical protein